ncbi:tRNA(Met) cytidine acetyltransferase TmcA [Grimontia marina]|uniref:tRNA(Met) cytidine acetyltransferase TmcA n=1 Tax=Grimontia marina TaxID=646534 RepID=A0A128FHD9_9GAMM|nr:tRNA(Met) cytidine acetyltransferase TmcA [Grimontia marina]
MNEKIVTVDPLQILHSLKDKAKSGFVRYPVFVSGDDAFLQNIFFAGDVHAVVSDSLCGSHILPWNKVRQLLGKGIGAVALDLRAVVDVDKLCVVAGSVRGGELLFLIVDENRFPESHFYQRFLRLGDNSAAAFLRQEGHSSLPTVDVANVESQIRLQTTGATKSQQTAIAAIKKVLSGHRRRPALLVADRGRGKSSAMGMAAAEVMLQSQKQIIVTSPYFSNVETLFSHAADRGDLIKKVRFSLLADNGSELSFVAPDALLRDKPHCDLLLVDEAAAIPLPMLSKMLKAYSRIAFSSTEHGYEGTGRAFSHRFRGLLNTEAKGWQEVILTEAVRWAENDPLESWLFKAFLFDAEPLVPENNERTIKVKPINARRLANHEDGLRQLFSLLVTAHYQTSPNDLVQLLDGQDQILLGAYCDGVLVGALLAAKEGGFDDDLAKSVASGKRRLKGHLLAQSLAAHSGNVAVLEKPLLRIVRIAVLPEFRKKGIGKQLVSAFEKAAGEESINIVGTSFGANKELWQFWSSLGYQPLRLGVRRDAASGTYSLQLGKHIQGKPDWFDGIQHLFYLNFKHQMCEQFSDMDTELVAALLAGSDAVSPPSVFALHQVDLFAQGSLGYDLVTGSLWHWFIHRLATRMTQNMSNDIGSLMISRLLLRHSWAEVSERYGFHGRKDTEAAMRDWIRQQLEK